MLSWWLLLQETAQLECNAHTLVSHVAVLHHTSALLVKYTDPEAFDRQTGWFLPNDGLRPAEHPENGAKRILEEQVGIHNSTLKLVEIESFVGDNKSWHLIFDYLAFPNSKDIVKGNGVAEVKWFGIEKLPSPQEFAHHGWGRGLLLKHAKPPD